ncbi:eukaryotic translation initiation factor 4 gamma-like [Patiria miniata]|uniref:Apple domain-containing protein n=1 Tax=Patiria miniata TaxID=46514 RepID=A0A914ACZ5_PATMI|nr:eukaryotic translation initiation factor 4 gamma-like [Patiria miniata]
MTGQVGKCFAPVLCVLIMCSFSSGDRKLRQHQFMMQASTRLAGSAFREKSVVNSAVRCSALCAKQSRCVSFNYAKGLGLCEMNRNSSRNHPDKLQQDARFKYYEIMNRVESETQHTEATNSHSEESTLSTKEPKKKTKEPTPTKVPSSTPEPTYTVPTTTVSTTQVPTAKGQTTAVFTTQKPITKAATSIEPKTNEPISQTQTTEEPTTMVPTSKKPTTEEPTTEEPTSEEPTTMEPTTEPVTTESTTQKHVVSTQELTTASPTSKEETTEPATTGEPTTQVSFTTIVPDPILQSCSALKEHGHTSDGSYLIDPDGENNGEEAFQVHCSEMTSIGLTTVEHPDSEEVKRVTSDPYDVTIAYYANANQTKALIDISSGCRQHLNAECRNAHLWMGETQLAWWVARDGTRMPNWGGAARLQVPP